MNDWITIAYQVGPVEIAVLKDRFEEEGIPFVISEKILYTHPYLLYKVE